MSYDEFSLKYGGGICPSSDKLPQKDGRAALVIGLGGQGMAALSQLKRNVHWKLQPDDPEGDAYQHIRFLGIDADGRTEEPPTLRGYGFLFLDHPEREGRGTHGIPLLGHHLIVTHAQEIYRTLRENVLAVMPKGGKLDVYLFAGICGGMGSCFLDICYILKKVLDDLGSEFSAHITGLFFRASVTIGRTGMVMDLNQMELLRVMELTVLKELADSRSAGSWRFHQEYDGFFVDTNLPPLDRAFLISAEEWEGLRGYHRAIRQAADYAFAQIAGTCTSISWETVDCGGTEYYQLHGQDTGKVLPVQLYSYLAAGFLQRLLAMKQEKMPTRQEAEALAKSLGLDYASVQKEIENDMPPLELPHAELRELQSCGVMSPGKLPPCWADWGEDWLERCSKKREQNLDCWKNRLAARKAALLQALRKVASDPDRGLDYAVSLLSGKEQSLLWTVENARNQAFEERERRRQYLCGDEAQGNLLQQLSQCSADFCRANPLFRRQKYARYHDLAEQQYNVLNGAFTYEEVTRALSELWYALKDLQKVFVQTKQVLACLEKPFEDNRRWVLEEAEENPRLHSLIPQMDAFLAELAPAQITWFADALLEREQQLPRMMESFFVRQFGKFVKALL